MVCIFMIKAVKGHKSFPLFSFLMVECHLFHYAMACLDPKKRKSRKMLGQEVNVIGVVDSGRISELRVTWEFNQVERRAGGGKGAVMVLRQT